MISNVRPLHCYGEKQERKISQRPEGEDQILNDTRNAFKRAVETAIKLTRGVSKGAKVMNPHYWGEVIHKSHGYGVDLDRFKAIWESSETRDSFNAWLEKLEVGNETIRCVDYVDEIRLQKYKIKVDQKGRISSEMMESEASIQHDTCSTYIFVISPDREAYIGRYFQGYFHHSSFMSGGPVLSAGELVLAKGKVAAITDKSGHYCINKIDLSKGLHVLIQLGVDLSCAKLMYSRGGLYLSSGLALQHYFDNVVNNPTQALSFLSQKEYADVVNNWEVLKTTLEPSSDYSPLLPEFSDQKMTNIPNRRVQKEAEPIFDADSE